MGIPHTITGWEAFQRIKIGQILDNLVRFLTKSVGAGHLAPDETNTLDPAKAITADSDQAAANAYINDLVAKATLHFAETAPIHIAADATNAFADPSDPASDLASCITAINDAKDVLNAHFLLAAATGHYRADKNTAQIATADAAVTLASVLALAMDCGAAYTAHIAAGALQDVGDYDFDTLNAL